MTHMQFQLYGRQGRENSYDAPSLRLSFHAPGPACASVGDHLGKVLFRHAESIMGIVAFLSGRFTPLRIQATSIATTPAGRYAPAIPTGVPDAFRVTADKTPGLTPWIADRQRQMIQSCSMTFPPVIKPLL